MIPRPDTRSALKGLKDFQRNTVDYVFRRFHGADPTRRFLVADEVGIVHRHANPQQEGRGGDLRGKLPGGGRG